MILLKKKIAVVTGTRAEYAILEPLIKKIHENPKLELQLYVTAMHLSKFYGYTIKEIQYPITSKIDMKIKKQNSQTDMLSSVATGITGFSKSFSANKPDTIIVLGDRIEQFAASVAALFLNIPIAHIHGGDISGGLDNYLRNMITKMASIHFPASNLSAKRIIALGEDPKRIYAVGAPGLDSVLSIKIRSKADLAKQYGLNANMDWVLILYHSDTLIPQLAGKEMSAILKSVNNPNLQKIIIYPNADVGGSTIISEIEKVSNKKEYACFKNIPHEDFISIMANCILLIGNSSSFLIESPSFCVPVVNIGSRQKGREKGKNVLDVIIVNETTISTAINRALNDTNFIVEVNKCLSPYGDGTASNQIVKILEELDLNTLLKKPSQT
ncbi:UDP-N-acetylglucosamine 2-epimerase (hydrolyzing) [Candidatus Micrarchaeota archaeon]|nr:UDP-N-acetylglucosamine 2-epimerase (hydrolyzing) [Candidatus Micrarchaeota archaeon]